MSPMTSRPLHVAIMMDGNGRSALRRGEPRSSGHQRGAENVRAALVAARTGLAAAERRAAIAIHCRRWQRARDERSSASWHFLNALLLVANYFPLQSRYAKKVHLLAVAHRTDQRFHVVGPDNARALSGRTRWKYGLRRP